MKRLNKTEWTDGKHVYVGNPKQGFTRKDDVVEEPRVVVLDEPVELEPVKPNDAE